ncbi:GVQW3 protein, partial [Acromyrmex charruanus]
SFTMEQRACIKFCFKLGKTATETHEMMKTVSCTVTFDWFKRFKEGRQSLDDDARSSQPSTARNEETVEVVREDPRLTFCVIFFPHFLTPEQKEMRVNCCRDFVETADKDPDFIKTIVTRHGVSCTQTKRQSSA